MSDEHRVMIASDRRLTSNTLMLAAVTAALAHDDTGTPVAEYDSASARVNHEGRSVTIHGPDAPSLPAAPRPNRKARRAAASRGRRAGR